MTNSASCDDDDDGRKLDKARFCAREGGGIGKIYRKGGRERSDVGIDGGSCVSQHRVPVWRLGFFPSLQHRDELCSRPVCVDRATLNRSKEFVSLFFNPLPGNEDDERRVCCHLSVLSWVGCDIPALPWETLTADKIPSPRPKKNQRKKTHNHLHFISPSFCKSPFYCLLVFFFLGGGGGEGALLCCGLHTGIQTDRQTYNIHT